MTENEKEDLRSKRDKLKEKLKSSCKEVAKLQKALEGARISYAILSREFKDLDMQIAIEEKLTVYNSKGNPKGQPAKPSLTKEEFLEVLAMIGE